MKSRPSGEKRRKEMLRQERQREKAEKRKSRKEERQERAVSGPEGETGADFDVDSASGAGSPLPSAVTKVPDADATSADAADR